MMNRQFLSNTAQVSAQSLFDITGGDVHSMVSVLLLQAAVIADLITEDQGEEEAHHFAHHMAEGTNILHQSTEAELPPQFEEEFSTPSLGDILNSLIVRGGRPQG